MTKNRIAKSQLDKIDCDATAAAGVRTALAKRFDEMYELRQAALKWKDPEGVHKMRVASRRLRSAATDFMPYLKKRSLNTSLKKIRSIADALGEVRDQDVAIVALETLCSESAKEVGATLQELIDARKEVRRTARHELKQILLKPQLKQLRSDFKTALATETAQAAQNSSKRRKSDLSYVDVARAIIRDRLLEFEKLSDNLYRPLEAESLHEMRIATKRLRYAIELFEDCLDSSISSFAKHMSRVQSALGRIHDCDVWIESFGKEIAASKKLKHREQSETFVWVFGYFIELRNTHFREAFSRWNEWESESFSDKLKEALKS